MNKMTNKKFPFLKGKALLSPMAGVTDVAFRTLCHRYGAALTYTEFVHSRAVVAENKKTLEMLQTSKEESPVAVQLFGNNIYDVINAAKLCQKKFDIVDINCGCPAWKVIRSGAGSALLNNEEKIKEIISKLSQNIEIPISLKIRKGLNEQNINAIQIAKTAEQAGASAIAIHGRTQKQGYSGKADWEIIKKIKQSVSIPVIGNGDVFTPEDFKKRLKESGVDYIMIARGAIGNPYIFKQINDYLKTGKYDEKNKIELFFEYLALAKKYKLSFKQIKNQAISFTKGIPKSAELRKKLSQTKSTEEIEEILKKLITSKSTNLNQIY